jgi:hypothetical protein
MISPPCNRIPHQNQTTDPRPRLRKINAGHPLHTLGNQRPIQRRAFAPKNVEPGLAGTNRLQVFVAEKPEIRENNGTFYL